MKSLIKTSISVTAICFALSPTARAVNPPPDGGYPGNNTAVGDAALSSLTTWVSRDRGKTMKLPATKKLVLNKETLRALTVKTTIKVDRRPPPSHNPTHCGATSG
ncbi:MAG: hypothetical protein ACREA0_18425 [bacterium]